MPGNFANSSIKRVTGCAVVAELRNVTGKPFSGTCAPRSGLGAARRAKTPILPLLRETVGRSRRVPNARAKRSRRGRGTLFFGGSERRFTLGRRHWFVARSAAQGVPPNVAPCSDVAYNLGNSCPMCVRVALILELVANTTATIAIRLTSLRTCLTRTGSDVAIATIRTRIRRGEKATGERGPAAEAWRSTSVRGRIKSGACLPPSMPKGEASSLPWPA